MEVLDAERMRRADERTIKGLKVPGLVLMENAGRAVAETIVDELSPLQRAVVLAGRGNNGGDGFVVARHLARMGLAAEVLLVGARRSELAGDARAMADAWHGLGGALTEVADEAAWRRARPALGAGDILVDALFGTGLARPLGGLAATVVEWINHAAVPVVAVDIPSGLFASEPAIPGPAVRADLTVTFARPKPAHLLPPAEDLCGDLVVADIGIPAAVIRETAPDLHWVTRRDAALLLPERDADDHKGRFGHVLVVAGGTGRAGAAALAGWGALRSGAGLVTVATPGAARAEVAAFAPELMTEALPAGRGGGPARGATAAALRLARERDVVALGPGLGREGATTAAIRRFVAGCPVPLVLDADGLNAFASAGAGADSGRSARGRRGARGTAAAGARALARHRAPLVITPHPGEAARLAGVTTDVIQADRLAWARRLASTAQAVCVLKGYRTITAASDGTAFINPTGNPGMASAGMGDALTGMIASFIAQQLEPLEAAVLGAYLHGLAADLALAAGETEETLTATAVLDALPAAFRALGGDDTSGGDGDDGDGDGEDVDDTA